MGCLKYCSICIVLLAVMVSILASSWDYISESYMNPDLPPMHIPGYRPDSYPSSTAADFRWILRPSLHHLTKFLTSGLVMSTFQFFSSVQVKTEVLDARRMELDEGLSKSAFFDKYGFVILSHKSAMKADDWISSAMDMSNPPSTEEELEYETLGAETPAKSLYFKEIESLIKQLVPTAMTLDTPAPSKGIRRGPGGWRLSAADVHSDFHVDSFESFAIQEHAQGQYRLYEAFVKDPQAKGFMFINFWRPVLPMESPLGNQSQLAMLDPSSIDKDDVIKMTMTGIVDATDDKFLLLKSNPKHKWYYYPHMTTDEVLVFKQAHFVREKEEGTVPVFHVAFSPGVNPSDAEPRRSFEYRIGFLYS